MHLLAAAVSLAALLASRGGDAQTVPSTAMNVYSSDGMVELCYSSTCDASAPSMVISLGQLMVDTVLDTLANNVTSSTVIGDFDDLLIVDADGDDKLDPFITKPTFDTDNGWVTSTLYAKACYTVACSLRSSNEAEFEAINEQEGKVGIKMEFQQTWDGLSIPSAFETYTVPKGGMRLILGLLLAPFSGSPPSLNNLGISFYILATENGNPTTNVTFSQPPSTMYLKRVHFGSEMYLDLPEYAMTDGYDTPLYVTALGHTSGELQDLIQVTIMFGSPTMSAGYLLGVGSESLESSSSSPPPSSSTPSATYGYSSMSGDDGSAGVDDSALPTQMKLGSRGEFGLCMDASCAQDHIITMGFAGLSAVGSRPLALKRFAHSPAFVFSAPRKLTRADGIETLSSSFAASVPQSRLRPPRSYDGSDARFAVSVDHFLAAGEVTYAGQSVAVPRGALKFSVNISDWQFASLTSLDELELKMDVGVFDPAATNGSSSVVDLSNASWGMVGDSMVLALDAGKRLEIPVAAIVDGAIRAVAVDVAFEPSAADPSVDAIMITFTFPAFAASMFYDPVIKSTLLDGAVTEAPTVKKLKKVDSWTVAGILLGLLALVVIISILKCTKKVTIKLDFSKVIP